MLLNFIILVLVVSSMTAMMTQNALVIGVLIFLCSMAIALMMKIMTGVWYAFIFFLLYVGGLLVLFFYILSFSKNPKIDYMRYSFVYGCLFFIFLMIFGSLFFYEPEGLSFMCWKDHSANLFSFSENDYLLYVMILLFLILWMITKLLFRNRMSMRLFK